MSTTDGIDDYEDVTAYTLDESTEEDLLRAQNELTFIWSNREGWPVGVIMSYVFRDGKFWCTASSQRKRVAAVRRDPRVCVVVTSKGSSLGANKALTYKGECVIRDDAPTKAWFYPALAQAINPDDPDRARRFARFLDSPRRVIFEITPQDRIGYDGAKMRAATNASPAFRDAL
ncbi:MAG TPA: pyridoxamine 5'-phosphate oxidase family protein [Acidimicrobiales bacterium]|nr:pyridoxamine 5'-phosphate oxidase family protein [Acidimicrobiales bacterium]